MYAIPHITRTIVDTVEMLVVGKLGSARPNQSRMANIHVNFENSGPPGLCKAQLTTKLQMVQVVWALQSPYNQKDIIYTLERPIVFCRKTGL